MSRIGKKIILLPTNLSTQFDGQTITVTGPKGTLSRTLPAGINLEILNDTIAVKTSGQTKMASQLHGLSRTLISNMIEGVSNGFFKKLQIQGVGYRSQIDNQDLILSVGYSHVVKIKPPANIEIKVENNTNITVSGIDKEVVGQVASTIRSIRPPEPYKGKGIRYQGEFVRRKAGKAGKGK
uniref:Large ribosomal subunit protein uL6c n=2 Tax=Pyropia yezoensis TaxID=2788 RepID=RK6_PYRYE|nr:ribosomal protein L6 [Neopyropia yezoensis]Q1XDI8.1 RecName: Full=Large ribosomal subunit protein uL6c; AltName: Full=50S ribosomal protein L6, chloroplastic [Neopyropia yezoensis]ABJ91314.1 50S ribosomal protein L6 [Neopyropia yezoensis]AGH27626.1 ribosomal protein L6 [Neopyropia yezoensis]QFZ66962.1 ribosomal protein L6 [Neopyropia yezoensis]ULU28941.1 ribosomal protein L6 [Neopyropia yezoensis]WKD83457.1 ribosomal protein L6 [Neopyropia yezoensis]